MNIICSCSHCKKETEHTIKEITHKDTEEKIDFDQFDIEFTDKSKTGKIIRKLVQGEHVVVLECHICNIKQDIECHIKQK